MNEITLTIKEGDILSIKIGEVSKNFIVNIGKNTMTEKSVLGGHTLDFSETIIITHMKKVV